MMSLVAVFYSQVSGVAAMDKEMLQNIAMICVIGAFIIIVIICVTVYCYLSRKQAKEIDERLFADDSAVTVED